MMYLNMETKNEIISGAATEIIGRYHDLATKIISKARKRESALQKMRHAAQSLDTDKICRQLFRDIQVCMILVIVLVHVCVYVFMCKRISSQVIEFKTISF